MMLYRGPHSTELKSVLDLLACISAAICSLADVTQLLVVLLRFLSTRAAGSVGTNLANPLCSHNIGAEGGTHGNNWMACLAYLHCRLMLTGVGSKECCEFQRFPLGFL